MFYLRRSVRAAQFPFSGYVLLSEDANDVPANVNRTALTTTPEAKKRAEAHAET